MNELVIAAFLSITTIAFAGCQQKPSLLSVHGKSVSEWVTATKDREPHVRKKAVSALQSVGRADPSAISALAAALQDQDASVRDAAALALLNIGPDATGAADALRNAQSDKNSSVRGHATAALARIQSRN
jgi:HEAT repeat protein